MGGILGIGTEIADVCGSRGLSSQGNCSSIVFIRRKRSAIARVAGNRRSISPRAGQRRRQCSKPWGSATRRRVTWTDIETRTPPSGQPFVAVPGAIKDVVEPLGVAKVLVRFAHCRTRATAYALALGREDVDEE